MTVRLNKYLSRCGLGSRRKVEQYIFDGRITINGKAVVKPGVTIQAEDTVSLDGKPLEPIEKLCYLAMNKPRGLITTTEDLRGRPTVMDLVPEKYKRVGVYPVGRLDKDTEGLLLFTNDGELAYRLMKPKYRLPKTYSVEIHKPLDEADKRQIEKGIYLHQIGVKTKPAEVDVTNEERNIITMVIHEGKKRQIRYTFRTLGYKIKSLKRTAYGSISLQGIYRGSLRQLARREVEALKKLVGLQ
jgi:pseudouridine synthase